jgi:hypothetical protein
MCQRMCLSSAFEMAFGPLGPEDLSWQKKSLLVDSEQACTAKTTQWLLGGITIFGGLAAIFAGLELAGLLHPMSFVGESPSYASLKSGRHMSVHRRGRGPASGDIYP